MRRLPLLALLAYGLTFGALFALNGELLVLAIPLVLLAGAGLLFGPEPLDVQAERRLDRERAGEGTPIHVTLTVTNNGGRLEDVLVEDAPPTGVPVLEGHTSLLTTLGAGESAVLEYTVQPGRGSFAFGEVRVTAEERGGLFRRRTSLQPAGASELVMLPDVLRVRRIDIRPRQTRIFAGTIPARVGGPGVEFFGVRGYEPADSPRHINWRASARHPGTLYTNEFQQERIADVGLILDARERVNVERGGASLFEYGVRATAALAESFLHDGNRVGLLLYGHLLDYTSPGYSRLQRERILRALARARPGESQVFDNLRYLPTRFFPPKSQIVLVSPLTSDDPDFLIYLRARGYELLVISPNPVTFEQRLLPATPQVEMAARLARVERALLFRRLHRAGVRLVDWDVDEPFERVVATQLARQPAFTRPMGYLR